MTIPDLPPYSAVVVVDMKDYSGHKGADHRMLTELIPVVLERTFALIGRLDIWENREFPDSTGDGYAIGFPPQVLPTLIGPFLDKLQQELEYQDQVLRAGDRKTRLRMRVAITVGPLERADGDGDGTGNARVEAHRLVDAEPVRRLLDSSDPDVTFVAAILSDRVYRDVVEAGYSPKPVTQYVAAPASVKTYSGNAYLHCPKPSGDVLSTGYAEAEQPKMPEKKKDRTPKYSNHNEFSGTAHGTVIQAGRIGRVNHDK
ncbi:hypothetical protein Lesp02_66210 [Lentzea sp. NBRC 105346]|uniref:hypothetical protein n=1 Tax=Lentzea sp. NBRC 105346 TaxID=3032205 RepID=UPI0024A2A29A|nr:hypothetical protein [Lentzea sp. NBRC 105346]GLZ34434.1 hypothetical protein Lesp02_66210 [Lentzea sp. NBRC 105346]